jgi:virginiamycin B lyase
MKVKEFLAVVVATIAVVVWGPAPHEVAAQGAAALTGVVSSQAEGHMEGVVVSARREGANFTVSVVSDDSGTYSFPRTHLAPGAYAVTTRAVGYDLVDPGPVTVAAGAATTTGLTLQPTSDLAAQLSSIEWINSMNGTTEQKDENVHQLLACNYCHTYKRIMSSRHGAEQFMNVIDRMVRYYADGSAISDDNRRGRAARIQEPGREFLEESPNWGFPGMPRTDVAEFFAMNNLSGGRTSHAYELQTDPRPTGKATRVIITEWDMPTPTTASHDSAIDSKGVIWFTDESAQYLGSFDTQTSTFKEYPMPALPPGVIPGTRDVIVDHDDNVWFPLRNEEGESILTKFDPRTEQLTIADGVASQFIELGPDGKVWAGFRRIDPATMKVDGTFNPDRPPVPRGSQAYAGNVRVDSKGNPWMMSQAGPGGAMGVDISTGDTMWHPIPGLTARRGTIDWRDRLWYGEYRSDRIAMFDTRTGQSIQWGLRPYMAPYTASMPDRNGYVYAPSNMAERLVRLDPQTGEIIEYQMPTEFDTKKLNWDPTTDQPVLWMANMRTARITRVEPID